MNSHQVQFKSPVFKHFEPKIINNIMKPNKGNPNIMFFQSKSNEISSIEINKTKELSTQIIWKGNENILNFGYFDEIQQFWVLSANNSLSFISEKSGKTIKTWKMSRPVFYCQIIGKDFESLIM